jgi:hypothetical protein
MKKLIALVLITILAVVFACVWVGAQEQRFKVGDRVEVDTFMRGDYEGADKYAEWRKGTVTAFFNPESRFGGYVVKIDQGQDKGKEMQIRFVDTRWIRTPQTPDANAGDEKKPGDQPQPNQPADAKAGEEKKPGDAPQPNQPAKPDGNGAVSCGATDDVKGTSQMAIFKRLIVGKYEKDGIGIVDKIPVSVHFTDFKIGTTHPYRLMVNNPDGPGGVGGGPVYPVKTSYVVCGDYPGFAKTGFKGELLKTEHENMTYSCFKDETGDWVCNQTGGRQGVPQHIPK